MILAKKVSEEMAERLGGDPKDYFNSDKFVSVDIINPKKFIYHTMRYPRWLILKQMEEK